MSIGLFLDRDGTVNEEVDFLTTPDGLRLIPGSAAAIQVANQLGLKVIIVTNQSGVARGLLSEQRLQEIHQHLIEQLKQEGALLDAIYYCPHLPEEGNSPYHRECSCRKPKPGMLMQAAAQFDIDLSRSFVVGDRKIDVEMGMKVGATTIAVRTGYGNDEIQLMQTSNITPDYIAENLFDAVQYIKNILQREQQPTE